jgi:carbonic anhydrase
LSAVESTAAFGASALPKKRVLVLACMDARLQPCRVLGLKAGDAHVLRNAGGVVTDDEIRSIAISQHLLGTREIVLIHHTDCGMLKFDDDGFADQLERLTGERPVWRAQAFRDLHEDLREQANRIKDSPFILHKDRVRAVVYDVATGRLEEVAI